jgi:hypothetical protein
MKQIILLFLLTVAFVNAYTQKLPNKQEASLRAPTNVKIDGKTTEWGEFKAYNSATGLFYTLANDEQNLYLILKAGDKQMMSKIFGAGISLFFNSVSNTDKTSRGVISYWKFPKERRFAIDEMMKDTAANDIKAINNAISAALKTVVVKNLDDVKGDSLSVYNEYGIMAAGYLSNANTYTCEIAIPLKHLKSFINNKSALSYTLQANAVSLNSLKVVVNGKVVENAAASPQMMEMLNNINQSDRSGGFREMMNDTNVSGEYTLAK